MGEKHLAVCVWLLTVGTVGQAQQAAEVAVALDGFGQHSQVAPIAER